MLDCERFFLSEMVQSEMLSKLDVSAARVILTPAMSGKNKRAMMFFD